MKLIKILSILFLVISFSTHTIYASVMDKVIVKLNRATKRPQAFEPVADVYMTVSNEEFSLDFTQPQGLAGISICDEKGYVIESFTASTDAPIVWYMTDYEGCTLTITTEYAEYTTEL